MASPLPKTSREPQYLEYFGMPGAPFARLASTKDLYLTEQYSFLLAHLANATEQPDSLILICGQNGSGKTSLLNRFITSISEDICFASINEFCDSEQDFFLAILRQFGFGEISGSLDELRYITHEFLVQQGKAGDPVLLLVDNAHLLSPNVFEQLRWMVSIKHNDLAVTNIILAGNPELARIMESPAMSQISARNHVRFNIRAYTEDETASYIWHRLDLVGGRQAVQFSADVHPLIYRFTGGIPRLINILCDAALQEAQAAESKTISGEMIRNAAEQHQLIPHAVPLQNKSRRRTDPGFTPTDVSDVTELVDSRKQPAKSDATATANNDQAKAENPESADSGLRDQLAAIRKQAKQLKTDAERMEATISKQSDRINELEDELEDKSHALGLLADDHEGNSRESQALRANVEKLSRKLARQDAATAKLKADLAERRSIISRLESDLSDASEKIAGLPGLEEASRISQQQLLDRESEATALRSELSILRRKEADVSAQLSIATARLPEVDVLKKAIADLEDEAESRSAELAAFRRQLSEQENRAETLANELRTSETERRKLEDEADRIPQLESELINRDNRMEDVQAALIERDEELRVLKGKLEENLAVSSDLETRLSDARNLTTQLEEKAERIPQLEVELTGRDEQIRNVQGLLAERDDELHRLGQELEAQTTASRDLEDRLSESAELAAELAARDEELALAKQQLAEQAGASADLEARLSESAKLAVELEERAAENTRLSEKTETQAQELAALQAVLDDHADIGQLHKAELARIGKLESLLEEATLNATNLSGEIQARDDSLKETQAAVAEAKEDSRWLKSEIQRLRDVDEKLTSQVSRSEALAADMLLRDSKLAELTDERAALQTELEGARQENAVLQDTISQLDAARAEVANLHGKLAARNEEVDSLKTEVQKQADEVAGLRSETETLGVAERSLAEHETQSRELRSQLAAADKEQERVAFRLTEQMKLVDAANEKIAQLMKGETELASAREALAHLEQGLQEKSAAIEALESGIGEKDAHLSDLQTELDRLIEKEETLHGQSEEMRVREAELEEMRAEMAALYERLGEQEALHEELTCKAAHAEESARELARQEEKLAVLADNNKVLEEALHAAQKNVADQAIELSDSHTLEIHASDLEEQLAAQLQINAEISSELERETARARELEARAAAIAAGEQPAPKPTPVSRPVLRTGEAIHVADGKVAIAVVYRGTIEQQLVREIAGLRCMIGRNEDNDMALDVDTVSRHHALLSCKDDYLWIEDLNSTNGVEINYKKVTIAKLHFGDVLSIGDYELRISSTD